MGSKPRSAHFRARSMTGTGILPVGFGPSGGETAAESADPQWAESYSTPRL